MLRARTIGLGMGALTLFAAVPAMAAEINSGDTAWIIVATALVLFMSLPGLALFYAGLVRAGSVLSVIMQCVMIACIASVLWMVVGYSLAFGDSVGGLIGGLDKMFFQGVGTDSVNGTIPEIVFAMFQMTFAIITPALIVGAYPERMKFSAILAFSAAWLLLVYAPVAHWVWGGGWMAAMGVRDFAGGIVVHATAGVSALMLAKMLGPRKDFPNHLRPPHNPGMTATGAAMLWVGWFGFNGGSQLAADGGAGMAIAVTHISAATAAITWSVIEWVKFGKPSLVGAVTGVIAGLATITPASGFVGPIGALIIGAAAGVICFYLVGLVKNRFKIDDSLDVFAVHGVGGILGTLLLAPLAAVSLGGGGQADGVSMMDQLGVQALCVAIVIVWSLAVSYVIIKVTQGLFGLRVDPEDENTGLDLPSHGERGYEL
jgi:ammonium transporter, Amt family